MQIFNKIRLVFKTTLLDVKVLGEPVELNKKKTSNTVILNSKGNLVGKFWGFGGFFRSSCILR